MTLEANTCTYELMKSLHSIAKKAAGRDVDVVQTNDGHYVVEWFRADVPPPKGRSVAEALAFFAEKMLRSEEDPAQKLEAADLSEVLEKKETKND